MTGFCEIAGHFFFPNNIRFFKKFNQTSSARRVIFLGICVRIVNVPDLDNYMLTVAFFIES